MFSVSRPVVGGDTFSPLAPVLGAELKTGYLYMSRISTVRGGRYDPINISRHVTIE